MLGRILSLFRTGDRGAVFPYFDGSRSVRADPLHLRDALQAAFPGWAAAAGELVSIQSAEAKFQAAGMDLGPKLEAEQAAKKERLVRDLVRAVRKAFDVKEYKAGGITDLKCIDLLAEYLAWVTELMEDTRPLPTPPAPTGLVPAVPSAPATSADSPSTPTESTASAPTPSPGPSAAPSTGSEKPDPSTTDTVELPPLP